MAELVDREPLCGGRDALADEESIVAEEAEFCLECFVPAADPDHPSHIVDVHGLEGAERDDDERRDVGKRGDLLLDEYLGVAHEHVASVVELGLEHVVADVVEPDALLVERTD